MSVKYLVCHTIRRSFAWNGREYTSFML